jgi:hypothetical protein
MSNFVLTDSQKVQLTISPVTAAGNPAKVDGIPEWGSSDDTILTVEPAADGLSCEAITTGTLGSAQVNVSADVDLGEGVETLTGALAELVRRRLLAFGHRCALPGLPWHRPLGRSGARARLSDLL